MNDTTRRHGALRTHSASPNATLWARISLALAAHCSRVCVPAFPHTPTAPAMTAAIPDAPPSAWRKSRARPQRWRRAFSQAAAFDRWPYWPIEPHRMPLGAGPLRRRGAGRGRGGTAVMAAAAGAASPADKERYREHGLFGVGSFWVPLFTCQSGLAKRKRARRKGWWFQSPWSERWWWLALNPCGTRGGGDTCVVGKSATRLEFLGRTQS